LVRRGTARNALGRHKAAYCDFAAVHELDPTNKLAVQEMRKTKDMIKSAVRKAPKVEIIPKIINVNVSADENSMCVAENRDKIESVNIDKNADACMPKIETKVLEMSTVNPSESKAVIENDEQKKEQHPDEEGQSLGGKQEEQKTIIFAIPKKPPKTAYEFNRVFKSLIKDTESLQKYMYDVVTPDDYKRVFSKSASLEAETLSDIISAMKNIQDISSEHLCEKKTLDIMNSIATSPGFEFALMFLSKGEKRDLEFIFESLEKKSIDTSSARVVYKLGKN